MDDRGPNVARMSEKPLSVGKPAHPPLLEEQDLTRWFKAGLDSRKPQELHLLP